MAPRLEPTELKFSRNPNPISTIHRLVAMAASVVKIIAAMSGVFLEQLTPTRVLVTTMNLAGMVAVYASGYQPPTSIVLSAFALLFVLRYVFLFLSFGRRGIAARLSRRYGEQKGFAVYEALTAFSFFARGVSFGWLIGDRQLWTLALPGDTFAGFSTTQLLVGCGVILATVGMIVNIWATRVVGVGTYYYRDLFLGRSDKFEVSGPYRYLKNPMYGLGQCAGFGAALIALSPAGFVATAANQGAMYLFNWLVEQPHVRRQQAATLNPS